MSNEKSFAEEIETKCIEGRFRHLEKKERRLKNIEAMAGGDSEFQAWILGGTMRMTLWLGQPGFMNEDPPDRWLVCATPMSMDEDGTQPPETARTRTEHDEFAYDGSWTPTHWVEIGDLFRGYINSLIGILYSPGDKDETELLRHVEAFCKHVRSTLNEIEEDLPIALQRYAEVRAARVQALGGYVYPDENGGDEAA